MPGKFIGIVNFNKSSPKQLIQKIIDLHYRVIVIDYDQPYYELINNFSHVTHWILVGDDYHLYSKNMPQLNMDIFTLDKHFLLTSSVMKSFLEQKGIPAEEDNKLYSGEISISITKHDIFDTLPRKIHVYRKHKHFFVGNHNHLEILNTYKKQIMTAYYKDKGSKPILLVQWQLEKTTDGMIILNNWID